MTYVWRPYFAAKLNVGRFLFLSTTRRKIKDFFLMTARADINDKQSTYFFYAGRLDKVLPGDGSKVARGQINQISGL